MSQTFTSIFNSTIVRLISLSLSRAGFAAASALAPGWTVRKLAQRFITPPRIRHTEAERQFLEQGRRTAIASPMGQLAAWQFGDPHLPAIVASHGWGGRGAQFRAFVPAMLDAGYQVWLFDHAGHGLSEGLEAPITDFARGVTAVTRHLGHQQILIAGFLGHSLGCAGIGIALRHDLRHLSQARVVQVAPPASLIRYSRFFARAIGLPERLRAAMQWRLEQKIGVDWQEFDMPHAAASLASPALVIHDQNDRDVRIESGLEVARAWPGARFKRTFNLGHHRILRDPAVIAATVDFLLDRVEFSSPPHRDEWSLAFASLSGNAPLY